MLDNADDPDQLHFGIFSQHEDDGHADLSFLTNLKYEKIHWTKAQGAGYARFKISKMYSGEDYYFQIDSHMRFAKGWDTELINQHSEAQKVANNEKIIISAYPGWFEPREEGDFYVKNFYTGYRGRVEWNGQEPYNQVPYQILGTVWAGKRLDNISNSPHPVQSWTVLAGYLFAQGSFIEEVPYDPRIPFMGEEICIAIRAYTKGWDIYSPNKMLVWHYYGRPDNERPSDVTNGNADKTNYWSKNRKGSGVIERILRGQPDPYGIEKNDRYLDYQKKVGYDFNHWYVNDQKRISIMNVLEAPLGPSPKMKTRLCINGDHPDCENYSCECYCHD